MDFQSLDQEQLDALKEISNIGMGHAGTALSQLIGKYVGLSVPNVVVTEIRKVPELLGGAERLVVGVYLQMLGGARGNILMVFPREGAQRLLETLIGSSGEGDLVLDEMEVSTLKEVGNILASAYLNALGGLLRMTLIPSIPMLACDMAGAVVDYVLIELGAAGDYSLVVETEFHGDEETVRGHFFVIPDPGSIEIILKAAGL